MKTIAIHINISELLIDLSNRIHAAASSWAAGQESNVQAGSKAFDVLEDDNEYLQLQMIDRLMSEVKDMLYPYVELGHGIGGCHNRPRREHCHAGDPAPEAHATVAGAVAAAHGRVKDGYLIRLRLPHERSEVEIRALHNYVRDYVLYKCQSEWMALTMPDSKWDVWEHKAADMRDKIAVSLVKPMKPQRLAVRPHLY